MDTAVDRLTRHPEVIALEQRFTENLDDCYFDKQWLADSRMWAPYLFAVGEACRRKGVIVEDVTDVVDALIVLHERRRAAPPPARVHKRRETRRWPMKIPKSRPA